jgi:hypothetical protein
MVTSLDTATISFEALFKVVKQLFSKLLAFSSARPFFAAANEHSDESLITFGPNHHAGSQPILFLSCISASRMEDDEFLVEDYSVVYATNLMPDGDFWEHNILECDYRYCTPGSTIQKDNVLNILTINYNAWEEPRFTEYFQKKGYGEGWSYNGKCFTSWSWV